MKSKTLSKAEKIREKDAKEQRKKKFEERRKKYLEDFEKTLLKESTFEKILNNQRVETLTNKTIKPQTHSFNTLAIKNKNNMLIGSSNNSNVHIRKGEKLKEVSSVRYMRGVRDVIHAAGNYYLYNSSIHEIQKLGETEEKLEKILTHNGNAFVGSIMQKTLDESALILGESWNKLIYFNLKTEQKFTIMETLESKPGEDVVYFYDHACIGNNKVILGTTYGEIRLYSFDHETETSELLDSKNLPITVFFSKAEVRPQHEYKEQICRVVVCPRNKIAAFHCWHRFQNSYHNSSIYFVEIRNRNKFILKLKYNLRDFKIDRTFIQDDNNEGKLFFFQALNFQGYRGDNVFLTGISFVSPHLVFSIGYNLNMNKVVCKRTEKMSCTGSVLQMKLFDREIYTVDSEGKIYFLG